MRPVKADSPRYFAQDTKGNLRRKPARPDHLGKPHKKELLEPAGGATKVAREIAKKWLRLRSVNLGYAKQNLA